MKRGFVKIVLFLFIGLYSSCNRSSALQTEIKEIDYYNNTGDVIEGVTVTKLIGSHSLIAYDSLVMIITRNPDAIISIYNTNSKQIIANLGTKGRANNEFVEAYTTASQSFMRNGHLILPLYNGAYEVKEVDVTQSLIEHKTVISSTFDDCVSLVNGSFLYLGTDKTYRFEYIRNVYGKEIKGVPSRYTVYESDGRRKEISFLKN